MVQPVPISLMPRKSEFSFALIPVHSWSLRYEYFDTDLSDARSSSQIGYIYYQCMGVWEG